MLARRQLPHFVAGTSWKPCRHNAALVHMIWHLPPWQVLTSLAALWPELLQNQLLLSQLQMSRAWQQAARQSPWVPMWPPLMDAAHLSVPEDEQKKAERRICRCSPVMVCHAQAEGLVMACSSVWPVPQVILLSRNRAASASSSAKIENQAIIECCTQLVDTEQSGLNPVACLSVFYCCPSK